MWKTLLSNFNESLLFYKSFSSSSSSSNSHNHHQIRPTRKQHIAVASALSENEGASEILMNARRYFCCELTWEESLKHFYGLNDNNFCSLSSFLAGSLVLHESNEKRWFNALRILNTMMEKEPWALRENFVRRVAIETEDPQVRLNVARKFVEVESLREFNENKDHENVMKVPLSPCDLLSPGLRHAIASRISISLRKSNNNNHNSKNGNQQQLHHHRLTETSIIIPVVAFWQQAIEFMTSPPPKNPQLQFPLRPSEFSNYLVACNFAYGMWKDALKQIPLHYKRSLFSSSKDEEADNVDKEDSMMKLTEDSWDPGARVSRFHCFQWMCATYASVPANRRPHELPAPLRNMATHLLHPCCFENRFGENKCRHFSELKEHAVVKSIGEANEVENSNPGKFDSAQACCNLVLMMQRSVSWVGATKILHEYLHAKNHQNDNNVFIPTLLHYNTCIDSNAGWQVCLQQFCRMRSQLGPLNAKKSWLRYVENYNSLFRKFANTRDPNYNRATGDVFSAHESQLWLRVGRSLERKQQKRQQEQHYNRHKTFDINHDKSNVQDPPLDLMKKFVDVAPKSVLEHPIFADFRTKRFALEEEQLPKVKVAEIKKK